MNTFAELSERRNKLMNDATALARTKDITKEQEAQVRTMLADVDVLEEQRNVAQRLEAFEQEQRAATRPPRGEINQTGNDLEEEKRALRNFVVNGERRDLGVGPVAGNITGGNQLVAPAFYPLLSAAQQAYGGIVNIVNQRTTDTGASMKVSFVNDLANGLQTWPEDTAATEADPALSTTTSNTEMYNTGVVLVTIEELQDSFFDINSFVQDLMGQRLYRGLAKRVSQGSTSGAYVSYLAALASGATSQSPTAISYLDIATLASSLDPAYETNATWVMNSATRGELIAQTDTLGRPLFIPSVTSGAFDTLLGRPVVLDQFAPNVGAGNTALAFGDFKAGYTLRNVGQFEIARDPYTYLVSKGAVAFIGYGRGGSFATDAGTHPIKVLTQHA
jgi:HK97 family phage major capsid protein